MWLGLGINYRIFSNYSLDMKSERIPGFFLGVCSSSALCSYSSHSSWSGSKRAHTLPPSVRKNCILFQAFDKNWISRKKKKPHKNRRIWINTFLSRKDAIRPKFLGCWMNLWEQNKETLTNSEWKYFKSLPFAEVDHRISKWKMEEVRKRQLKHKTEPTS